MGMTVRELFPTLIDEIDLGERRPWPALAEELSAAVAMLAEEDTAGKRWCRDNAYPGYTSYASLNDLPKRATAFADLKRVLDREVEQFAAQLNFDLGGRSLKLDSLWVNVLRRGGFHSGHIHPSSVISGTVYLSTPPGSGELKLEDPRLPQFMAAPSLGADTPEHRRRFVYLRPREGMLYLWESWLRHEVTANMAKTARVSMSFNYS